MPRYIIERNVGDLSRDDLNAAGKKAVEVLAELPEVVWIKSFISEAEGKIYCEYDAPNPDALREHARLAGLPIDKISEVALEVSPDMFQ